MHSLSCWRRWTLSTTDDPQKTARSSQAPPKDEVFDADLKARIDSAFTAPCEFVTVANQASNRVTAIEPEGMWIETAASAKKGSGPQLVPAWMFNEAWRILRRNGELTQQDLLNGVHGQAVKRSAAVVGVLARLDGVEVVGVRPTKVGKRDPCPNIQRQARPNAPCVD